MNTADLEWRKSSRSNAANACVEVALTEKVVAVRDSKNAGGPILTLPTSSWIALLRA